jgi:hypothetical protein
MQLDRWAPFLVNVPSVSVQYVCSSKLLATRVCGTRSNTMSTRLQSFGQVSTSLQQIRLVYRSSIRPNLNQLHYLESCSVIPIEIEFWERRDLNPWPLDWNQKPALLQMKLPGFEPTSKESWTLDGHLTYWAIAPRFLQTFNLMSILFKHLWLQVLTLLWIRTSPSLRLYI